MRTARFAIDRLRRLEPSTELVSDFSVMPIDNAIVIYDNIVVIVSVNEFLSLTVFGTNVRSK